MVTPEDIEEYKDFVSTIVPAALSEGIEIYGVDTFQMSEADVLEETRLG